MKHKLPYFSHEQRKGILGLAMLIVLLQGVLFFVKSNQKKEVAQYSVDAATERYLDSLGELALKKSIQLLNFRKLLEFQIMYLIK